MASRTLSVREMTKLLGGERPKQKGPVRWYDAEMRCGLRGCASPTYLKVQGLPRCMKHAVSELNEMLVEAGFLGVV